MHNNHSGLHTITYATVCTDHDTDRIGRWTVGIQQSINLNFTLILPVILGPTVGIREFSNPHSNSQSNQRKLSESTGFVAVGLADRGRWSSAQPDGGAGGDGGLCDGPQAGFMSDANTGPLLRCRCWRSHRCWCGSHASHRGGRVRVRTVGARAIWRRAGRRARAQGAGHRAPGAGLGLGHQRAGQRAGSATHGSPSRTAA